MAGGFLVKDGGYSACSPRGLGSPGSAGDVCVHERERESLGGSKPQALLVSQPGPGSVAGAAGIAPTPGLASWGRRVCPGVAL